MQGGEGYLFVPCKDSFCSLDMGTSLDVDESKRKGHSSFQDTPSPEQCLCELVSGLCVLRFSFSFSFFCFSSLTFGLVLSLVHGSPFVRAQSCIQPFLCALSLLSKLPAPPPATMQGARCPSTMATVSPRSSRSFRTLCPWSPACVPVRMGAPLLCTHSLRASPEWHHSLCPELCLLARCGWTCHML